jgi:hypothetical protein
VDLYDRIEDVAAKRRAYQDAVKFAARAEEAEGEARKALTEADRALDGEIERLDGDQG